MRRGFKQLFFNDFEKEEFLDHCNKIYIMKKYRFCRLFVGMGVFVAKNVQFRDNLQTTLSTEKMGVCCAESQNSRFYLWKL